MNGTVIVWQMVVPEGSSEYKINSFNTYQLYPDNPRNALKNPMYHIQSLQFRLNYIIAGTRSGDIYFLCIPEANDALSPDASKSLVTKVFSAHDNEIPKEADFTADGERIFCITQRGLFSSWDYQTCKNLVSIAFEMPTVSMVVFKTNLYVAIAFEKEIVLLDISKNQEAEVVKGFGVESLQNITDIKVSMNEEFLAVAIAPSVETNARIELYSIHFDKKELLPKKTIEGIYSEIEFMDFSTDDYYLMYKDTIGQKCFFDIENNKKNDTLAIDFDVEWVSEGIKISEKRRGLDPWYKEDNIVTNLVRAGESTLIATDEIGTVSHFYRYSSNRSAFSSTHVTNEATASATASTSTLSTSATFRRTKES